MAKILSSENITTYAFLQNALHWIHALKLTNKLSQLSAACSVLVLVTWISEIPTVVLGNNKKLNTVKEEHLAAASTMVQNFLLVLTAHGMGNYWSSGGDLGSPVAFKYLEIPDNAKLVAALFIE